MSVLDSDHPRLAGQFGEDTHNVLLLAPPMDGSEEHGCVDLLTVDSPAAEDVLFVTFVQSPDERLDYWHARVGGELPANVGFVNVDDETRSAAALSPDPIGPDVSIRAVSSPADLTDLGIKLNAFLTEWAGDGNRTVICFHSLTTLLQYVDLPRAFRFFHAITGRVRSADALAHYHMDPTAHDTRTVNTLKAVFDGVAEWNGEDWRISNR